MKNWSFSLYLDKSQPDRTTYSKPHIIFSFDSDKTITLFIVSIMKVIDAFDIANADQQLNLFTCRPTEACTSQFLPSDNRQD